MTRQRTITFPVSGMHCAQCAQTISKKVGSCSGVIDTVVNFGNNSATVTYDPAQISTTQIESHIIQSGFGTALTSLSLTIENLHTEKDVTKIRNALETSPGVFSASVSLAGGTALIRIDSMVTSEHSLKKALHDAGYPSVNVSLSVEAQEKQVQSVADRIQKLRIIRIIISFLFSLPLMALMLIKAEALPHAPVIVVITPVFLFVAYPVYRAALTALSARMLTMDVMYALGITTAFGASLMSTTGITGSHQFMLYDTALMLTGFLTLGRFLEAQARGKTGEAIKKLLSLQTKTATVEIEGTLQTVPVEEVTVGQIVLIRPGDRFPVDGEVLSGESTVDESMLTGEPVPNTKQKGSKVTGGTINITAPLRMIAQRTGDNTMLASIIRMVREAQASKPPFQKTADTIVAWFIPVILAIALLSFSIWYFLIGVTPVFALTTFIAVLVVACPCALGLASPTAVTVGIGRGAELGILIKNGDILEKTREITTVLFDKTGTLTIGKPTVTIIESVDSSSNLLRIVASLEANSTHPLADAILIHARNNGCTVTPSPDAEVLSGKGVHGSVDGQSVAVGNRALIGSIPNVWESRAAELETNGMTVVFCSIDNRFSGIIAISDEIKPSSYTAIDRLTALGLDAHIISGDNRRNVSALASQLKIAHVSAEVSPIEKSNIIAALQRKGKVVAFVGDGINDAAALAQADIGIAIGSGTDIAVESADMVLVKGDPVDTVTALQLGQKVYARIRGNIFWAFAYNTALIPLASGILYPLLHTVFLPEFAGLAMALSSVTVVTRSLMLKNFTPGKV